MKKNCLLLIASLLHALTLGIFAAQTHAQQPWPVVDQFAARYATGTDIQDIAWDVSGQFLGVATANGFQMLDEALQPITELHAGDLVRGMSWKPDGTQVALAVGTTLEIWAWDDNTQRMSFMRSLAGEAETYGVFWSPDGQRIAGLEIEEIEYIHFGKIRIWETVTWQTERLIDNNFTFMLGDYSEFPTAQRLVWSPDGSPIFAGVGWYDYLEDGIYYKAIPTSIYTINVETGEINFLPLRVDDIATSLDWHPGGDLMVIGGRYGAEVYKLATSQFIGGAGPGYLVYTAQWDPSGEYVASGTGVARAEPRTMLGQFETDFGSKVVAWKLDGFTLTIADFSGVVSNWDVRLLPGYGVEAAETGS